MLIMILFIALNHYVYSPHSSTLIVLIVLIVMIINDNLGTTSNNSQVLFFDRK